MTSVDYVGNLIFTATRACVLPKQEKIRVIVEKKEKKYQFFDNFLIAYWNCLSPVLFSSENTCVRDSQFTWSLFSFAVQYFR